MKKMKRLVQVARRGLLSVLVVMVVFCYFPRKLDSANLTSVSDTLSSSRLSFVGAVGTGNSAGTDILTIKTSSLPGWATSDSNHNLFPGDTLLIGDHTDYTVEDIIDDASDNRIQISRTGGLAASDIDVDDPVIATRSARHTVTFTTVSLIAGGKYRIRLPASSKYNDGIPDADGFDFRETFNTSWIDCSSADSGTASIEYSGQGSCPSGWTCIYCSYSGTNTEGSKTIHIGTTASAQQPINPAPSSTSKTLGSADTYTYYVEHLDASNNVIDSTAGKIAVVESVRVTATVDPTITFTIAGVGVGVTACENTLDVTTTATTVPFGSLSLGSFNDAAQQLSCVTNASGGYVVTVIEDDQLSIGGDHSTELSDTNCDSGAACSENSSAEWSSDTSESGFGYSLHNIDANTVPFQYSTATGNCSGTFCARPFPATADGDSQTQIMSNSSTPTTTEDIYVCYRLVASSTQPAGDYENNITYRATATF